MTVPLREVRGSGGRSRQAGGRDGGLQKHLIGPAPPPLCRWMADRLPAHDPLLPLHGPLREGEIPSERRRQRRAAPSAVRSRPRSALRQDQPTPPDQAEFVLCEQTILAVSRAGARGWWEIAEAG